MQTINDVESWLARLPDRVLIRMRSRLDYFRRILDTEIQRREFNYTQQNLLAENHHHNPLKKDSL